MLKCVKWYHKAAARPSRVFGLARRCVRKNSALLECPKTSPVRSSAVITTVFCLLLSNDFVLLFCSALYFTFLRVLLDLVVSWQSACALTVRLEPYCCCECFRAELCFSYFPKVVPSAHYLPIFIPLSARGALKHSYIHA